jgi:DNA-binding IclR family transcriptional regulator
MRLAPAVVRAFDILDAVAGAREPPRVAALARTLGIPRNTAYELVNTLVARDLAQLDSEGRVRLGFHLFELGSVYSQSVDLFNEARPIIRDLARTTGDTGHLAMLDGRQVVFLVKEEGSQSVRNISAVGRRIPAHASAVGKAILAFLPREDALRRLEGARLERLTPQTMTALETLLIDLDATAARGYSIDIEESNADVSCLGAPIRNDQGVVVAGISLAAHVSRMDLERREELARLLMRTADQLSRRLGYPTRGLDSHTEVAPALVSPVDGQAG